MECQNSKPGFYNGQKKTVNQAEKYMYVFKNINQKTLFQMLIQIITNIRFWFQLTYGFLKQATTLY